MAYAPLLSAIVFVPVVGGLLVLALWRHAELSRGAALGVHLIDFVLALLTLFFTGGALSDPSGRWFLVEDFSWIERFGIRYTLALDGISLVLIVLTAFLGILCVLVSWRQITTRVAAFHFFLLLMQTAVMGVFLATDLFLFYLFWELQLIPMFFLIGIWGHEEKVYATVKFFLFSIAGSLLMLIALIGLFLLHGSRTGVYTFALARLMDVPLTAGTELWLFSAFMLAFAIKVPIVPVHTWLPDAHTEAPTAGSVILAGLLLKTGVYAILRFAFPLFPLAARTTTPVLLVLGLIGLFYAAWIAFAQHDMKRLVAYSSIGHMGLIVIGLAIWNTMSLSGAVLQMLNHGLSTSALFILVGMLDERLHSRAFSDAGGLWKRMPVLGGFFMLFGMSSVGLPGLNNFAGEILILLGTFKKSPVVAIIAFASIVFVLVYILRLIQDTFFGEPVEAQPLWDVTPREMLILVPLTLAVLFIGLYPDPVIEILQGPIANLIEQTGRIMTARAM